MRKHTLSLVCIVTIVSFTCGCNSKTLCELPSSATDSLPSRSSSLKVDVFLDGTLSMKGFVVPGITSRYAHVLPILESTVERGWPTGEVVFHKFGTTVDELPGRDYLKAQQLQFYLDSRINKETQIQNVIEQSSTDRMTIIVTDLFQTDVDVNLLTREIKQKFIANNLAVGILGIKSEFNGEVYDVGPNNYTFHYESDNTNTATFRPFYILAFGNHADISNYFEVALKGGLESVSEIQAIIFSPYVSETVASFDGSHITDTPKLQEISNLLPADLKADHVKQFRIPDASVPLASFTANLNYKPMRYVMSVASPELEAEVTAFTCGSLGEVKTDKGPQPLTENGEVKRAFTIRNARVSGSAIDLTAEIIPAALPGAGVYCFKTILRPKVYSMPDWVSGWDMESGLVEAWKKAPKDFNGATTFNLKAFLTNLWENTLQSNRPKVAEFYSYIEKK